MSDTSPMYYAWLGSLLVPPVVLVCDATLFRRRLGLFRGALLSAVAIFFVVVGTAVLYESHLHAVLATFDRDANGIFAGDEVNPEQQRALLRVTNDLSRNLAPFTGGAFAVAYSTLVFGGTGRRDQPPPEVEGRGLTSRSSSPDASYGLVDTLN